MKSQFSYAVSKSTIFSNSTCGLPKSEYFNLVRDVDSDFPWTGMSFGLMISSIWYWCSDQVIVQRALAAKNLTHARAGCILAGYLKFFPVWIMLQKYNIYNFVFSYIIFKFLFLAFHNGFSRNGCKSPVSRYKHAQ
jgi:uncharacterized sodium:solute symporter family permease YidK